MSDVQWFYTRAGRQDGPFSEAAFRDLAAGGQLQPGDLVWCQGMPQWAPAGSVPGLLPPSSVAAPPIVAYASPMPRQGPPGGIGQDAGMRWLMPVGRSGWAIAAGYLGLFSFVLFPAPIALAISIVALIDIKKHPGRHGMGRAIFGLIMGIIGSIFLTIMLISMASHR